MSPLFAALPPTDLPTMAYVAPTGIHLMARDRSHTVREGDTVYDIATRHGVSVEAVVRANSLADGGRWVLPGTVLRIPGGSGTATAVLRRVRSSASISRVRAPHAQASWSGCADAIRSRRYGGTIWHRVMPQVYPGAPTGGTPL